MGESIHARRSKPAEPVVAYSGMGILSPIRGSNTFTCNLCITFPLRIKLLGHLRNNLCRHIVFTSLWNLHTYLRMTTEYCYGILIAVEADFGARYIVSAYHLQVFTLHFIVGEVFHVLVFCCT